MIRAVFACSALCVFLVACGNEQPEPNEPVDSGTNVLPIQKCLDNDGDGVAGTGECTGTVDCDDKNSSVFPGATETCNDRDDDCDGLKDEELAINTYFTDGDGDGYGAVTSGQGCGPAPTGSVLEDGDCDDADASRHPGATETCNAVDDDCDTNVDNNVTFQDFYADADGDGFGDASGAPLNSCMPTVQGRVLSHSDCDDMNPTVKPGAQELCNRVDDNCDGQVDNGITYNDYYPDIDGDGFGDQYATPENSCSSVAGKVLDHTDCDDSRSTTKPNAPEQCNDIDDNCNGQPDEGLSFATYYTDADGDGFGATGATPQSSCAAVAGKVTNNTDCNDANPAVKPSATEICNGVDDDCAGGVDNGLTVYQYFTDADGDGYGAGTASPSCLTSRPGMVTNSSDCNDGNSAVHPGATESCNNVDDDCTGGIDNGLTFTTYYPDADGDTFGSNAAGVGISSCQVISGRVTNNTDCNDANAAIKPGAAEVCDNVDNNCSGGVDEGLATQSYYADNDGDGYGAGAAIVKCGPVGTAAGRVLTNTDCNDNNAAIRPGATEVCDGIDNNCVGGIDEGATSVNWYLDNDGDGYGTGTPLFQCQAPAATWKTLNGDCNDNNAAIKPGAAELCDGVDNNCVGGVDEGIADGASCTVSTTQGPCRTGVMRCSGGAMACAQTVFPTTEVCDAIDNNCDGTLDNIAATSCTTSQPGRCQAGTRQCQGTTEACVAINGPISETCNSQDDDCDGSIDELNPGGGAACTTGLSGVCSAGTRVCQSGSLNCVQTTQPSAEICDDLDNNCNGAIDETYTAKNSACDAGAGVCFRSGVMVCNAAHTGVECSVTAGSPTAAACDGLDNDCDGITDEPQLTSTATIGSVAYDDMEVRPYYFSSGSCRGGAMDSGTDALAGGALLLQNTTGYGMQLAQLNASGAPTGSVVQVVSDRYDDVDFAQAGDGFIAAGIWYSAHDDIDLYYTDALGTQRTYDYFAWSGTGTTSLTDSLRVVRSNGRRATVIWRDNGVGIKLAKVEACQRADGGWFMSAPGCAAQENYTTSTVTIATTAAGATILPGIGADSNVVDWTSSQSCLPITQTRKIGIAYLTSAYELRFFTINDDGTGKSAETVVQTGSATALLNEPDVTYFKNDAGVDQYAVAYTIRYASSADLQVWHTNAPTYWAWDTFAATGAGSLSITRPRMSASATGLQIVAQRADEIDGSAYLQQVMTRNLSFTGAQLPDSSSVEVLVTSGGANDAILKPGNKVGLTNYYPWGRIFYSGTGSTPVGSYGSTLTCN